MRIREAVEKNYNALPGYKLVGYSEVAIPIFQRRLQVLVLCNKSIPVVEQFVLNFYNEGLNIDEIREILGITQQLLDEAWVGLIQRDYIDNFTREVTDLGKEYLIENKVEKLEKKEIQISIDGLTGKISKINKQLMLSKTIKEKGIKALKSDLRKIELDDIDFKSVKRVYRQYGKNDIENYSGDLLDIIEVYGNTTRYRRVDILLFQNSEKELRILAYDDYNKIEEYEEKLLRIEDEGNSILSCDMEEFFIDRTVQELNSIIKNSNADECEIIKTDRINAEWEKYLSKNDEEMIIAIPLVNGCKIDTAFIEHIDSLVKDNVNIKLIVAGKEFSNAYQQNSCLLLKRGDQYSNFMFQQVPCYINKMILNIKNSSALVSVYDQNEIISNGSKNGIIEVAYELRGNSFNDLYSKLMTIIKNYNIPIKQNLFTSFKQLNNKIKEISVLAKDCDGYMNSIDGIGWFEENGIPDMERLLQIPLARSSESFRVFVDSLNKSLVESLEQNAKLKRKQKYFWREFKDGYPKLFDILNKIKTYRNKGNHLKLDDMNKEKYFQYLQDDLNGFIPEFVKDGYMIIQENILIELEKGIRDTLNSIRE
ncbi:MAG: hypothetical protein ABF652_19295 [Clostridium beijerinckii]